MKSKYVARAAAIIAGVALSALPVDAATVHAAPSDPAPPCMNCDPGPGGGPAPGPSMQGPSMKGPNLEPPGTTVVEPPTGGGPKSGRNAG
jgi:hypothetical protein